MLKKNKLFQTERVRQQNSIVIYYYTTTENSGLINSMTKLEILKWTYSDKDHKGNTLSSLLIHGRSTQIKEKWQNKHNPSKSATSLQFWNAPSETTVCMVWWRQTEVSWVKITCVIHHRTPASIPVGTLLLCILRWVEQLVWSAPTAVDGFTRT